MSKLRDLMYAISGRNDPDMVKLLREMSIDEVNAQHNENASQRRNSPYRTTLTGSALHVACLVNNRTAVALLLSLNGIEVNPKFTISGYIDNAITWCGVDCAILRNANCAGYTPIMIAAAMKHKESFELLLQNEKVNLKAAVLVNGKEFVLAEMFEDLNEENHNMLIKLLAAMRKRPTIDLPNIEMPRTNELEIFKYRQNNFGKLLESGEMSDFRIICEEETFACHKSILFAQSNVLRTMFNNEMRESTQDFMTIVDLEPAIVKILVKFIYTGDIGIDETKENANVLLEVADRYELKGLTRLCENQLMPTIDNSNVLEMIVKADLYHADNLREVCIKWIFGNKFDIVKQEGWKQVLLKFPDLMTDMVDAFTKKD